MSSFKIGNFNFINLSRLPGFPVRQMTREARPGVDGITLWLDGRRAQPIMVASVSDAPTLNDAIALVRGYEALVGGDPVDLLWASNNLVGVKAVVGGVWPREEGVRATVLGIGGVNGTSRAICYCEWLLHILATGQ